MVCNKYFKLLGEKDNYIVFIKSAIKSEKKDQELDIKTIDKEPENWEQEYREYLDIIIEESSEDEYIDCYYNITKECLIVKMDSGEKEEVINEDKYYDFIHVNNNKYIINAFSKDELDGKVEEKQAECELITTFTYLPDKMNIYDVMNLQFYEDINKKDLDYLYMYGYLLKKNCTDGYYMTLLKLLYQINTYKYNKQSLYGFTDDCVIFANQYITDDKLLKLINMPAYHSKVIKKFEKGKRLSGNKYIKYNQKLVKAWEQYKKTGAGRSLLRSLMRWYESSDFEANIMFSNEVSYEMVELAESLLMYKTSDIYINTIDEKIRSKGFEGQFPIYYRRVYDYMELIYYRRSKLNTINIGGLDTLVKPSALLGVTFNTNIDVKSPLGGFYECYIDGKLGRTGFIQESSFYTWEEKLSSSKQLEVDKKKAKNLVDVCIGLFEQGTYKNCLDKKIRIRSVADIWYEKLILGGILGIAFCAFELLMIILGVIIGVVFTSGYFVKELISEDLQSVFERIENVIESTFTDLEDVIFWFIGQGIVLIILFAVMGYILISIMNNNHNRQIIKYKKEHRCSK